MARTPRRLPAVWPVSSTSTSQRSARTRAASAASDVAPTCAPRPCPFRAALESGVPEVGGRLTCEMLILIAYRVPEHRSTAYSSCTAAATEKAMLDRSLAPAGHARRGPRARRRPPQRRRCAGAPSSRPPWARSCTLCGAPCRTAHLISKIEVSIQGVVQQERGAPMQNNKKTPKL